MKKYIFTSLVLCSSLLLLNAQTTEFDAINLSQKDIKGTARYMGMAGAFGALGGDVSAVKDNPAGLGVFRRSELTTTFNVQNQKNTATWDGYKAYDDLFKLGFNNFSYVMSFNTKKSSKGLQHSNFAFSYNRLKSFNRNITVKNDDLPVSMTDYIRNFTESNVNNSLLTGSDLNFDALYDDISLSWLSVLGVETNVINHSAEGWGTILEDGDLAMPSYYLRESGYVDEYAFSWGGNISNIVYLGTGFNFTSINYSKSLNYKESYSSDDMDLNLSTLIKTRGTGFNLNLGVIVRPIDQLRLGVSYQTPTVYTMSDKMYDTSMDNIFTPNSLFEYELKTPGRLTGSAAYVIGQRAIISGDIAYVNYRSIKLYDVNGVSDSFEHENDQIRNKLQGGILVKIGAEFRITDQFALRAGFATETKFMESDMYKDPILNTTRVDTDYFIHDGTNYFTLGLGYANDYWSFDLAFVNRNLHEKFAPYHMEGISLANVTTRNFDLVLTVGLKF